MFTFLKDHEVGFLGPLPHYGLNIYHYSFIQETKSMQLKLYIFL